MTEADFQELVGGLSPRSAQAYRKLLVAGPLVPPGDGGDSRAISRLAAKGLARTTGKLAGRRAYWEAVRDPAEVEAAAAAFASRPGRHHGKRWLPSSDLSHPPGLRLNEMLKIAEQPDVRALMNDPEAVSRKERARIKEVLKAVEQKKRHRAADFIEAQEQGEAHVQFIKIRNDLDEGVDTIHAMNALIEDEVTHIVETGEPQFPIAWWLRVIPLLAGGVAEGERAYELVARITGSDPLPERVPMIDGEDIEDAELILELTP